MNLVLDGIRGIELPSATLIGQFMVKRMLYSWVHRLIYVMFNETLQSIRKEQNN